MRPIGACYMSAADNDSYEFDCAGLARRELKGKDITATLPRWAEDHYVTLAEMRTKIDAIKARWKPYALRTLKSLRRDKAKGKVEVYVFDLGGKLLIDEAIRLQEEKLARF
jgi:hypothetical protein